MKIEINTLRDTFECETCGMSWAFGGQVFVDGEMVLEKEAIAHCYGGQSYSDDELLVLALREIGHEVLVDGQPYHISQSDAE